MKSNELMSPLECVDLVTEKGGIDNFKYVNKNHLILVLDDSENLVMYQFERMINLNKEIDSSAKERSLSSQKIVEEVGKNQHWYTESPEKCLHDGIKLGGKRYYNTHIYKTKDGDAIEI